MQKRNLVERCKEKGIELSYMTIYRYGKKEGFIGRNEVGELQYDDSGFEKWLEKVSSGIPSDSEYISDAVKKSGVKYSYFLYYLRKEGEKILKDIRGKKYASRNELESIIENYNRKVARKEK